jgi:hypothetical protein
MLARPIARFQAILVALIREIGALNETIDAASH